MNVDTKLIERWMSMFRPELEGASQPRREAEAIDAALSRDGNASQRIGMWLALLERDSAVDQYEALHGIGRVLDGLESIASETSTMLLGRLAMDGLWFRPFALDASLRIASRLAELNPGAHRDVATFALRVVACFPDRSEALAVVGRFATLDDRTILRLSSELPNLEPTPRAALLDLLETRIRNEAPEVFVPYVEGIMTWWDSFEPGAHDALVGRLVPILNTEILRDFTRITPLAFERTTNAIANAPQMNEELRRSLIRELVPHSRDLTARQPIAPPLLAALQSGDESVLDQVLETALALDPLAAAGLLLNVIERLKTSPLRFPFAERLIAAYGDYDIVRRAATIDILGREMWRFLGQYADASPVDVEGLAEASEPFIDVLEIELVEQLRGEIDQLRLRSFPRV